MNTLLQLALAEMGVSNNGATARLLEVIGAQSGTPAQARVYTLDAATINAHPLPHNFILGGFDRMYLVTGVQLLISGAGFIMPGKTLSLDNLSVGVAMPGYPHVVISGNGILVANNLGGVTVDSSNDVALQISSNNNAPVTSGFLTVTVFAVPLA